MKALVLTSGGVDSTTALGLAIQKYGKENVIALSISYGQKHDKEIQAAIAVSEFYGNKPCGKCGTCIDRAAAFQANHTTDPAL